MSTQKPLKVAVLCGGPSPERGISLNSARSVSDHLESENLEVVPIYFDYEARPFQISRKWLYSNTPSDFDFKLAHGAKPLSEAELTTALQAVDLTFPVMHGKFGEDGGVQRLLEDKDIPYIGTSAQGCERAFDKYIANEFIMQQGFFALPSIVIERADTTAQQEIADFFVKAKLERAIVKPATGGSSIGVFSVSDAQDAFQKASQLLNEGFYSRVVIEPFCTGIEFTAVIIENRAGEPVSLLPVEIDTEYTKGQIFDFRKKYLPTRQVTYHCPPTFDDGIVQRIQDDGAKLFSLLGMRDFARFDGWVLPDGNIWFSDFNPISGMEQNSFLFLEAARCGMTHRDILNHILLNALDRHGLKDRYSVPAPATGRKRVNVIFGGSTAERQVSVMTGTNIWLKLTRSECYEPQPYLLAADNTVWKLPYALCLNHTAEEIGQACLEAQENEARDSRLRARVQEKLTAHPNLISQNNFLPQQITLDEFVKESDLIFNGLHGGFGENGDFQVLLSKAQVPFTGPGEVAARLCANKYEFGQQIIALNDSGLQTAPKELLVTSDILKLSSSQLKAEWERLGKELFGPALIVKPVSDGCSAGVVLLQNFEDLTQYLKFLKDGSARIPIGVLTNQRNFIEMPASLPEGLLFERFIETDDVMVAGDELKWTHRTGWIEITVGLLGPKGKVRVLNPSITVASEDVLSVEEKFQGGTGINITPPPEPFVKSTVLKRAKESIEKMANQLGLHSYSRIDAFLQIESGDLIIIEANTLPALTPSTVIFHQALAEEDSMYPLQLLEKILKYVEWDLNSG